MTQYQEPPGGDFVAYLDQLQRESAARIGAPVSPGAASATPAQDAAAPVAARLLTATPMLDRQQADELRARLAYRRRGPASAAGRFAFVLGLALLVLWFTTRASVVSLLIAVGLLVWGGLRLARREGSSDATVADRVQQLFHPPPPPR